jgi:putative nucleotidyltransferase with HDIG domain
MIPDQILDGIKQLDPLPITARRLSALVGNEKANIQEIAQIVEYDAAIAANVLRVANSPAFAGRYPVEKIREAVVRLGTANLLNIAMEGYLKIFKTSAPLYDLTEDELYLHSAAAAIMIKALTSTLNCSIPPAAAIAALLHDIGKLIMVRYLKSDLSALLSLCNEKGITFVEAEREVLGCDHAEVGGAMAHKWGFPQDIIMAIEQHHQVLPNGNGIILDAVMLANYAAKSIGIGLGAAGLNMPMDFSGSCKRLGISIGGFELACAQGAIWLAEQRKSMESAG